MTKLIVAFSNFANTTKDWPWEHSRRLEEIWRDVTGSWITQNQTRSPLRSLFSQNAHLLALNVRTQGWTNPLVSLPIESDKRKSYPTSGNTHSCMYVGFKTPFYVVRRLDSTVSYLPTGLHLGFFRSWPSLYLPSSFLLVSASTSILLWVIFLLPFLGHGRTMYVGSVQFRIFLRK